MADGPPARIDRAALERIIQRATELQTHDRGDLGDSLTTDEVVALGKEVGIPGRFLQQAMLEERTRVVAATPSGLLERVAGPGTVAAQRVVLADPAAVETRLVRWMEDEELMCVQRRQPGRVTFEQMGGFHAAMRRSTARRRFMLRKAETVGATVTPLESGYCHVVLTAEVRGVRGQFLGGAAAVASTGVAATAALLAMTPFLFVALAPLPLALGLGYGILRQFPPQVARVQLGLERVLDQLEQQGALKAGTPERPPSLINLLADEMRRALANPERRGKSRGDRPGG
jgi:hypothetical protein